MDNKSAAGGSETGGGRWTLPVLLGLVFMSIVGYGVVVPLLPFYGALFDAPPWQVTLMFSAYSVGQLGGELFWGALSDRIGRKPVILITIFASALGYVMLAFSPNIWVAVVARGVSGFMGGNLATVQGYVVDISPRERLSGRLALVSAAMGTALVAGPALGGLLARPQMGAAGFALPALASAAVCCLGGLAAWGLLRESRTAAHRTAPAARRRDTWKAAAADPTLTMLLGTSFLAYCAFGALNSVIGLWGLERFGWSPREVGGLMAVTGATMVLTQLFATARIARRLGEPATLLLAMGLGGVSLFLLPLVPSGLWAVPCLVAMMAGMSLFLPTITSLASDSAGAERQGAVLGLNSASGAFGRVAGPLAAGAAISAIGISAPLFMGAGAMAGAGLLAWSAGRRIRNIRTGRSA